MSGNVVEQIIGTRLLVRKASSSSKEVYFSKMEAAGKLPNLLL